MGTVQNNSNETIAGCLGAELIAELASGGVVNPWCNSVAKRTFDLCLASLTLLIASPLMIAAALAVKILSPGPVLFRQRRCGRLGTEFEVLKFRTMHNRGGAGPGVTRSGDGRVTGVGRLLRKWKLDELPQLINVVRGEMSIVGPRPDLPKYFAEVKHSDLAVLALTPGITSPATLQFRDEESLLAGVPADRLEQYYVATVLPEKIRIELDYARSASFGGDLAIIIRTAAAIFHVGKSGDTNLLPTREHESR